MNPDYVVDEAGCWIWSKSLTTNGYGRIYREGRQVPAHRVYYERHVGPIPEGMELDHLCRVRNCVNPQHLEPVTHLENMRRSALVKLTDAEVQAIRCAADEPKVIAQRYGISRSHVYSIRDGTRREAA